MITIILEGQEGVARSLDRVRQAISPTGLGSFLEGTVDPYLRERILGRFATEGDMTSGKWEPLTRNTGYIRHNKGFPALHPINVRTGALRTFVAETNQVRGLGTGAQLTKPNVGGTAELQRKLAAAARGGVAQGTKFPARPVAVIGDLDARWILDRLWLYVEEAWNSGGGTP